MSKILNSFNKASLLILGFLLLGIIAAPFLTAHQESTAQDQKPQTITPDTNQKGKTLETANLGAGCFWCVEAVFDELEGVQSVESGYMGGRVKNPTYEQVCSGLTGHAEIAQIKFDPNVIFLEIQLPAQSGLDLARKIKFDHPDIIIVILTSYDLPEYQAAAEESGVEHLIPKDEWTGMDMIDLVQLILSNQEIDEHEARRAGNHPHEDSL